MRQGRKHRLAALYRDYGDESVRLAYFLTGSKETAQDVLHDAFVKLASRPLLPTDEEHARRYLFRTVMNLSHGQGRRRQVERRANQMLANNVEVSSTVQDARDVTIWRILLQLPLRQRTALYLRYYEDLSESQTADIMGCSPSAIKSLIHRSLRTLRTSQGGEHG